MPCVEPHCKMGVDFQSQPAKSVSWLLKMFQASENTVLLEFLQWEKYYVS